MFFLILSGLFGYLLGSIPTAYILVRWRAKVDIRKTGSGSVGAFNSYDVTKSKLIGAAVLVIDLLKGVAAVFGARLLFGPGFSAGAAGGIGATLGHNYPLWLGFKGGRGLATATGVMITAGAVFVLLWGAGWFAGYKLSKDINIGNAVGSLLTLIVILVLPSSWLMLVVYGTSTTDFRIFGALLLGIILMRLIEPVREYFATKYHHQAHQD